MHLTNSRHLERKLTSSEKPSSSGGIQWLLSYKMALRYTLFSMSEWSRVTVEWAVAGPGYRSLFC